MKEQLIQYLTKVTRSDIKSSNNIYYDCESNKAVMSLRINNTVKDKIILLEQMIRGINEAQIVNKDYVYIIKDPNGIYYCNVSETGGDILLDPAYKVDGQLVYNLDMIKL